MKKLLLLSASCLMLLSACKKDSKTVKTSEEAVTPKYPVNLNVTGFSQTTAPFAVGDIPKKATTALVSPPFTKLTYFVFDLSGKQVSRMEQTLISGVTSLYRIKGATKTLLNRTSNFGSVSDTLATGDYNLLILGTSSSVSFNGPSVLQNTTYVENYKEATWETTTLYPNGSPMSGSQFMYTGPLGVTSRIASTDFALDRIHGALTLNIEDALPTNAYSINAKISGEALYYNTRTYVAGGTVPTLQLGKVLTAADKGTTNYKVSWYLLNTSTPLSIVIECKDASNNVIATKTVSNVTLVRNRVTTLSGALFSLSSSINVVSVNDTWDLGSTVKF